MMKVCDVMSTPVVRIGGHATLDEAIERMDADDVRHLPVVDGERLVGVLSERDLLEVTGWLPWSVREVLEAPAGPVRNFMHAPVVTVSPDDSLATAALRLFDWGIGCVPVLDEMDLVGMLTETDLLEAFASACEDGVVDVGRDPDVAAVMTSDVLSAEPKTPAEEALAFCRRNKIRHLPLLEQGRLIGIVSDRDLRCASGRGQLERLPLGRLVRGRPLSIEPGARLSSAARRMVDSGVGGLPVVEGQRLIGMLTSRDVVEHCVRAFAHEPRRIA